MKNYSGTEFPKDVTYSKNPTRSVGNITATLPKGIEVVSESNNRLFLNNKTSVTLFCRIINDEVTMRNYTKSFGWKINNQVVCRKFRRTT